MFIQEHVNTRTCLHIGLIQIIINYEILENASIRTLYWL